MPTNDTIKVWDPLVRVFHWSLALVLLVAFVSEDELLGAHVWAGYAALGLVGFRLLWGVVGTRYARFSGFVRGPRTVLAYLKRALSFDAERHVGHNPAAGAMVVALLVSVMLTAVSGLVLLGAEEAAGPLAAFAAGLGHSAAEGVEELHEFLANFTLFLVLLHLAGVALASLQHRENLVRAMFTGRKARRTH
jgi:cytochrome b